MDRHLEQASEPFDGELASFESFEDDVPLARPVWWRWVAVIVVIALVVATSFAFALRLVVR